MSPRRPPPSDEADKPAREMTPEEVADLRARLQREIREFERPRREKALRQGRVKPRTMKEAEIFAVDLLKDKTDGQGV